MAGLVPATHVFLCRIGVVVDVDARDKPWTSPGKGLLMGWFRRFWLHRAAKQYARKLGSQLARAYGPSEHYSAPQIRAAVAKLGLNPKYIALGYAGFLPEDAFAAIVADMPSRIPY